jgi:hypothetical protein
MPQDIGFYLPFSSRVSHDEDAARWRDLAWARAHGLVAGEESEWRYLSWDIAGLMARWIPEAVGPGLDLATNAVSLTAVLDDQIDAPSVRAAPDLVAQICSPLIEVMDPGVTSTASLRMPLVAAFTDIWHRLISGMPESWQERGREEWTWYFEAYVDETRNRASKSPPNRHEHFKLRRKSGFVHPMLSLIERVNACILPERVRATPEVSAMLTLAADVVDTMNDVHSLEKEELRGDFHNLVLVKEHERSCSRNAAIHAVRDEVNDWVDQFIKLAIGLPRLYESLCLTTSERDRTDRMVASMRSAMAGHYDWSRRTDRYSPAGLIPPDQPAYPL